MIYGAHFVLPEVATVPTHASIQKKILHVLYLDELLKSSPWHKSIYKQVHL